MVTDDKLEYERGYNMRLRQLLETRGLPRNSRKPDFLPVGQLRLRLDHADRAQELARNLDGREVGIKTAPAWRGTRDKSAYAFVPPRGEIYLGRADLVTVDWTESSSATLVATWTAGKMTAIYHIREGLILQLLRFE